MYNLYSNLAKANLIPTVLKVLSERNYTGYQIIKKIRNLNDDFSEENHGHIYTVLHHLEKNGLISSYWKKNNLNRKRKYYSICKKYKSAIEKESRSGSNVMNKKSLKDMFKNSLKSLMIDVNLFFQLIDFKQGQINYSNF